MGQPHPQTPRRKTSEFGLLRQVQRDCFPDDLPPSSLRLSQQVFFSSGMDCLGPYLIKIGRCTEKRWGIVFKCLTTHAVHLDLLANIDTDTFLMALHRFIARRGKPHELLSDQGTNFRGGSSELHEAFKALTPKSQAQLADQQITFKFNPPKCPTFWRLLRTRYPVRQIRPTHHPGTSDSH